MIKNALLGLARAGLRTSGRNALAGVKRNLKKPYRRLIRDPIRHIKHPNTKYRYVQKPYNKFVKEPAKKYIRQPYRNVVREAKLLPNTLNPRRIYHGKTRGHWPNWKQNNPIDTNNLKSLGKWTGTAAAGTGLLGAQGSPLDRPQTYGAAGLASLAAFIATKGRAGGFRRSMRFPVTTGAGVGGMLYGREEDKRNQINIAEAQRLERNRKALKILTSQNRFLHGESFGVDPLNDRYSEEEAKNLEKTQLDALRAIQEEKPDYSGYFNWPNIER